jgi:Putative Actinobacterial Holin-X, holin superfamily III
MADEATPIRPARARATSVPETDSAMALVRRLIDEVLTLFRQEIALATAELSRSLTRARTGIGSIATGGAVAFAGLLLLLQAAVLGLALVLPAWLAALIVGAVVGAIGLAMVSAGKRRLEPGALAPTRTQESLRRDKELLERRTT